MRDSYYTHVQTITIYAIVNRVEGPFAYIGKTTSPRISAVYSRHRTGNVSATEGYLDLEEEIPELYVLERLSTTGAEGYRHVLAWLRYFLAEGYYAITHEATEAQARSLYPETEDIYRKIAAEPLETILERTYVAKPSDANLPPEPPPRQPFEPHDPAEKSIQMNVRMYPKDKARFDILCRERGFNQRQGFSWLLEQAGGEAGGIYREKQNEIDKLKRENQKLRDKLAAQNSNAPSAGEAYLAFLLPGLKQFFDWLRPPELPDNPLPRMPYRKFLRSLPSGVRYVYPDAEGFYQLVPEAVVWGAPPRKACFVMSRGENGERYRLRTYPRDHYAGYSFRDKLPVGQGVPWLIGVRRAKDGAMEIAAAFPLIYPPIWEDLPELPPLPDKRKPSLGAQIENAQRQLI